LHRLSAFGIVASLNQHKEIEMLKRSVGTLAILSTLAVTGCSEVVDPGHVGF